MMIETSLIRLREAVENGRSLNAGTKVVLPIGDEAEIYGFIAIEDDLLSLAIDMPPLGECQVFANRVIFYLEKHLHRFPIFRSVDKAKEQRYGLYLLYVPKLFDLSSEWDRKNYIMSMRREKPNPNIGRIEGIKIEENVAYYYPNDSDLYFECQSKLKGVASGFVVITRRISKLSGKVIYEIFDSDSVMIERE